MLRKTLEYWYPTIGFGISISLLLWRSPSFVVGFSQDISSAFFTIFSICCGFVSTSLSILFSFSDRRSVKGMKSSGVFDEIILFHWKAIGWSFAAIIGAFLSVLLKENADYNDYACFFMLALGIGARLAGYRVVHLFIRILRFG